MPKATLVHRGSHVGLPQLHKTDRTSFLSAKQACNIMAAAFYAEAIGTLLYLFVTIAWRECPAFDNSDDKWNQLQRHILADLRSFCAARGIPIAFIWVRERKPGIGAHTHLLLHLGCSQIRPRTAVKRLRILLNARYGFGPRGLQFGWNSQPNDRFDRLAYILKGMDPAEFRYIGLDQQHLTDALGLSHYTDRQQGKIQLQRYGMSRNLASKARAECCDWREMRDLDAYKRALQEPYFALLQRNPALQPPDPALSRVEQLTVRYNDPAYYHLRRCEHYRRLRLPTSEDWPRHLIGDSANRSVTFT